LFLQALKLNLGFSLPIQAQVFLKFKINFTPIGINGLWKKGQVTPFLKDGNGFGNLG
jgi:hypothetical protein